MSEDYSIARVDAEVELREVDRSNFATGEMLLSPSHSSLAELMAIQAGAVDEVVKKACTMQAIAENYANSDRR